MGLAESMATTLTGTVILNIIVLCILVPVLLMIKKENKKRRAQMGKVLSFRTYRRNT